MEGSPSCKANSHSDTQGNSLPFVEEGSLMCSQESASEPYPGHNIACLNSFNATSNFQYYINCTWNNEAANLLWQ
jgi:hypothetical protein